MNVEQPIERPMKASEGTVYTIKGRCRVCYTCVRECPVKAIKIMNGQAEVIAERCIVCGNCVTVCSQGAKTYTRQSIEVMELLNQSQPLIAMLAPSYVAEFIELTDPLILPAMLRKLGFDKVTEVAFGADLVAGAYKATMQEPHFKKLISSDCPAIVNYIEKHHPQLIQYLAPIDSPVMAMAKVMKTRYGSNYKIVFIGPCIAKKNESDLIDFAITFTELRSMLVQQNLNHEHFIAEPFDPPIGGKGAMLPISHGLLHNIELNDDLTQNQVLVAQGRTYFRDVLEEYENNHLEANYVELLCCDGCIMGPGMSPGVKRFHRRDLVGKATKLKLEQLDMNQWEQDIKQYAKLDLHRTFKAQPNSIPVVNELQIEDVLASMGKTNELDFLNCGACGYETCRAHAQAVVCGLAETEMCLPFTIEKLNKSNLDLATARQALLQSERLAHMGQLSAGIAHELNNPLGVITMYSHILKDEIPKDSPMLNDLELIAEQANRCKNIVGGLLNFARKSQVNLQTCEINNLVAKSIDSIIKPDEVTVEFRPLPNGLELSIDPDQMMQVLTNIEKNAIEAMPNGGLLSISVNQNERGAEIHFKDQGSGISPENMDKIFTPFFTTKPYGKGTGLGLPLIYGIIKMHKGDIVVHSNNDPDKGATGTEFILILPLTQ